MPRIEDELRGATVSMNRWRNGVDDDGPSGAARAGHLHLCAEKAAHEIDMLREAVGRYCDKSRMAAVEPSELQQAIDRCFEATGQ